MNLFVTWVGFLSKFVGSLCPSSVFWNLNYFPRRLFLRSFFEGFSFDKSFFLLYRKVSICLKCVFASRIDFPWILCLCIQPCLKTVSVSDVSAVNLIVGWCKFACSMKGSMSGLLISHREKYRLCSISKLLVYRRFCLELLFQYMPRKCWQFGNRNCCLCSHCSSVGL